MVKRTKEDFQHERQVLDAAHLQNEASRDSFVHVAHLALFAASIAFVADVAPLESAVWKPVLIFGWLASIVGMLSLTLSFPAARKAIDRRRDALNEIDPPKDTLADCLNGISLWSLPIVLLSIFLFVTANVVDAMVEDKGSIPGLLEKGASPPTRAPAYDGRPMPAGGTVPAPRAPISAPPSPTPPAKK